MPCTTFTSLLTLQNCLQSCIILECLLAQIWRCDALFTLLTMKITNNARYWSLTSFALRASGISQQLRGNNLIWFLNSIKGFFRHACRAFDSSHVCISTTWLPTNRKHCLSVLHFCTTREMEAGKSQHLLILQNSAMVETLLVLEYEDTDS